MLFSVSGSEPSIPIAGGNRNRHFILIYPKLTIGYMFCSGNLSAFEAIGQMYLDKLRPIFFFIIYNL
jgi:hypothetical protein